MTIKISRLSKEYRLGVIGHGTLRQDLESWWAKFRGKEDPNSLLNDNAKTNNGRILALDNINLNVKKGEIVGIIGGNGAGKSTLLKVLSRITAPSEGIIKIEGRMASLLEVGTGFHPELTGRENIFLNGSMNGLSKAEISAKLDEIISFANIEKYIDTPVKRYSSGMYVRLGFSVAAHIDPDILVVDEVLAVGDADFQKKCIGKMKDISIGSNRTILFVSHNMSSIRNLCNRAILIESGRVKMDGSPAEVIDTYLSSGNSEESDSPFVDLTNNDNHKGTGEVSIEWAMLQDSNKNPTNNFSIGDDVRLIFSLINDTNIPNFSIVILIKSSDGIPICKIFDEQCGFRTSNSESLEFPISVLFEDIRLYPDKYFLTILVRDFIEKDNIYYAAEEFISFEITDGGNLTTMNLNKKDGRIYLTPKWENMNVKPKI